MSDYYDEFVGRSPKGTIKDIMLQNRLKTIAKAEGGPWFLESLDRWLDDPHWRCVSEHVSTRYLRTENGDKCLACGGRVYLTFPEDRDGPLGD